MNKLVTVKLWGTKVGTLGYKPEQTEVSTFEYDEDFIKMGVELSPLRVPINQKLHTFDDISKRTYHGLAGFLADTLPDKFGSQLIDQYFASIGKVQDEITSLDRLLYVGSRAMGALEFEPSTKISEGDSNIALNLQELSELSEMLLTNKEEFSKNLKNSHRDAAIKLLRVGSSAGGARSKALVALDEEGKLYDGTISLNTKAKYYLLKFDSCSNSDRDNKDPKGMTRVEYIYSLIAKQCGINMPNTDYIEQEDDFHFLIERFDRKQSKTKDGEIKIDKLHYVSWCGMAHAHRDEVGAYSYEQLILTARQLGLGQDSILEIFKRAVFNIIGRNQDDHTKNFGFLMNRKAVWSLSPAFDMTYSYDPSGKWTREHQISLNNKRDKFTSKDIIDFGIYCNLKEKQSKYILEKTINEFKKFESYADKFSVDISLKQTVLDNLRVNILD